MAAGACWWCDVERDPRRRELAIGLHRSLHRLHDNRIDQNAHCMLGEGEMGEGGDEGMMRVASGEV